MTQRGQISKDRVYRFIADYIHQHQRAPTYREIGDACDMVYSAAYYYVSDLYNEGFIDVLEGVARGISLIDERPDTLAQLAWNAVDAWDAGGMGEAIRALQEHLIRVAPRS